MEQIGVLHYYVNVYINIKFFYKYIIYYTEWTHEKDIEMMKMIVIM